MADLEDRLVMMECWRPELEGRIQGRIDEENKRMKYMTDRTDLIDAEAKEQYDKFDHKNRQHDHKFEMINRALGDANDDREAIHAKVEELGTTVTDTQKSLLDEMDLLQNEMEKKMDEL